MVEHRLQEALFHIAYKTFSFFGPKPVEILSDFIEMYPVWTDKFLELNLGLF